jgi:hypothetical protein
MRPILKILYTKRAGRVAQVAECLSSKCEAGSSNSSTAKKKKKKKKNFVLIPFISDHSVASYSVGNLYIIISDVK